MGPEIKDYLDKNNLHHAYLIEGGRDTIIPQLLDFLKNLGINTFNSPDFQYISVDSFKIEDARNLKSVSFEKGFFSGKKIFLISANNFLLEAQNALLKIFEEPIENTHFFLIVPDINFLLKTFTSRFYVITNRGDSAIEKDAEDFLSMRLQDRIDFLKDFLKEREESDENIVEDSIRSKAGKFLNTLEIVLHNKFFIKEANQDIDFDFFHHLFKVREFLHQPGSPTKTLLESLALAIPVL
ncbi:hypothetical protein KKA39_01335 [Patescibacteria group bacterium]|nr:hypothetical protein [Patescibacteria group bacterium]MBU1727935.1 hypothetical protein [Patescibacteria group bacterium]